MKKLLMKIELKRFDKLVNDENSVLFTEGNTLQYVYNKKTKKSYYPQHHIEIVR